MKKGEFKRKFKAAKSNLPCVIVELEDATFYADDYFFVDPYSTVIALLWRGICIGHCEIKSILKVY